MNRTWAMIIAGLTTSAIIAVVVIMLALPDAQTVTFEIPGGTAERIRNGEDIRILPPTVEMKVGDKLILINDDVELHMVGPYSVRPGERFEVKFTKAGKYPGTCTVNKSGQSEIVVT